VARSIVVSFRMSPSGMSPGPEGNYLSRARSLCIRGEALGARLVAWSAAIVALGWDSDSIEDALQLAAGIREEALSPERAWACGLAEGELESLSPDGEGILAWGPALVSASSLAHVARPGEVLLDGQVRALRAGELSVLGVRASADVAQSVRGWRLDLVHPWKRPYAGEDGAAADAESTDRLVTPPPPDGPPTDQEAVVTVERIAEVDLSASDGGAAPPRFEPRQGALAERIRKLAQGAQSNAAVDALAELRRARARAEGGPVSVRCHASLALALTLSIAGRAEEALLEALDALARAREADEPKAIGACMALLAKLYAGVGYWDAATALREGV
jgi:hypothetical protein